MTRPGLIILLLCISCQAGNATGYFEISPLVRKSYESIISLRFNLADSLINELRIQEPENRMACWLENYQECLAIFISENETLYGQKKGVKRLRLTELDKADILSPYHRHIAAEIQLHWAMVRLKFRDYLTGAWEIKKAYSLLVQNNESYPGFLPSKRTLAILRALIGMVPDNLQWAVSLVGMEGSIEQGMAELREILLKTENSDFLLRKETQIAYAYMMAHLEQKPGKSWEYVKTLGLNPGKNPMDCFVMANLAMRAGNNDEALGILERRPAGSAFFPVPYLDFMEGMARLYRMDREADIYLLRFVRNTRGRHYVKEAYQKLAWHALIQDSPTSYTDYMNKCKTHGASQLDEDQQALREARYGLVPDKRLLTARLFFDGGYYKQAYNLMMEFSGEIQSAERNKVEFNYRMGRICHALENDQKALYYYQMTIDAGRYEGAYFACNSSLMAGSIWEAKKQYEKAASFYRQALEMNPDEYRISIHQKARTGLNRLVSKSGNN